MYDFQDKFCYEKAKKIFLQNLFLFRSKTQNLSENYLIRPSLHACIKCLTCMAGGIFKIFVEDIRNSKILHVVCHNLSQSDVTKTLRPVQAVVIVLPMILNTDLLRFLKKKL